MIKANFSAYSTYVTDSLNQWDLNQVLQVPGLNLTDAPEVHFSNSNTDRAIVRQSTMTNHVVSVAIPNSLLQDPLRIYAHIGIYEGSTFKVVELVEIPVLPRKRPLDYQIEDSDEEVYSFKRLENEIANMATKAQVANIVAGVGSDAELVDVRYGADGVTYASAGAAIRKQFEKTMAYKYTEVLDADADLEMGAYFVSSTTTVANLPSGETYGGMLLVYLGNSNTRDYQVFHSYHTGKIYTRNNQKGTWTAWTALSTEKDLTDLAAGLESPEKPYLLHKVNAEELYIYRRGNAGYIRHQYLRHTDEAIGLDTWKLGSMWLCDASKNATKQICSAGYDNEGVLKIEGEDDYIGGVHGREKFTDMHLYVDGKAKTIAEITDDIYCESVSIIVASDISHAGTSTTCINRTKQITFDRDGVHVNNKWTTLEAMTLVHVRGSLLSVNKDVVSQYYDSTVYTIPMDVPDSDGGKTDSRLVDTIYTGDIYARVWCGNRGGSADQYKGFISDFGTRLKSYFDCYTGYTTKAGEVLSCQNNFIITC